MCRRFCAVTSYQALAGAVETGSPGQPLFGIQVMDSIHATNKKIRPGAVQILGFPGCVDGRNVQKWRLPRNRPEDDAMDR